MKKSSVGTDLTEGNILNQILKFVFPLLLANIVQQLYNTVDMIIIGWFCGNGGTVGISNGGEAAALITFGAMGLSSAAQIYVAQLSGAKKKKEINEVIVTSITLMMGIAIIFTVLSVAFCNLALKWLHCPEDAFQQAYNYMMIVSLGLPFVFGYNIICGILRGMGEAKRPFVFISIAAISNVLLDLVLVAVFRLEAAGTAIATIIAQLVSFAAAFVYLIKKKEQLGLEFHVKGKIINVYHMKVLLKLGIPLSLNSICVYFAQLVLVSNINTFGIVAAATNSIGNKIQKLLNVFVSSIMQGAGAIVGQNLGAKKIKRVTRIVYTTLFMSLGIGVLLSLISVFLPQQAFRIFTKDPEVIKLGVTYMYISIISFILSPIQSSYFSVITGSGNIRLSIFVTFLDAVVLRVGVSLFMAYVMNMGVIGFFYGAALPRAVAGIITAAYFYSGKWKSRPLLMDKSKC